MKNKEKWVKKKNQILPLYNNNSHLARPFTVHSYLIQSKTEIEANIILEEKQVNYNEAPAVSKRIRNSLNKNLKWYILGIFLVMLTIIVAFIVVIASRSQNKDVCLSSACISAAYRSLKYLDSTIDPCVDFYSFACGNFIKEAKLTSDSNRKNLFSTINEIILIKLKNLINGNVSNNNTKTHSNIKKTFDVCMSYQSNSDKEIVNIKSILDSLGGWPMLLDHKWNESNFDLIEFIVRLKKLGIVYQHLFYFEVDVDTLKSDSYIIRATTNYPTRINQNYYNFIVNIGLKLGANRSIIEEDMYQYLKFSLGLLKGYVNIESMDDRYITLKRISSVTGINWSVFLNRLIDDPNITITGEELILTSDITQFLKIIIYIFKVPKRMQANYFFVEILVWMYKYLPGLRYMFEAIEPDTNQCALAVTTSLPLMINSLYVKKYFDVESKTIIEKMAYNIRDEFMKVIASLDWLDDNTRKNAMLKLVSMKICVGYPEELVDDVVVNNYYKNLSLNFTTYLSTIMSINAFEFNRNLKRLRQPVKNCYWIDVSEKVTVINAEYYLQNNGIRLLAAILQDATFDKYRPNYMNYATVGMIIGHEMTHGFDNMGKLFDKDGNYKTWWSDNTTLMFYEKAQCIVNQYEQYLVPQINMKVNGLLTLGENIADNGGLKHSFSAYSNWAKQNGPEKMLPGLNYTTNQMFWIAFAQLWCSYEHVTVQHTLIQKDEHAPTMFRVIGTLSNIQNFSTDFKCPLGSPMNPKKKCSVW